MIAIKNRRPELSDQEVEKLAARLGVVWPVDYAAFLRGHNVAVPEGNWFEVEGVVGSVSLFLGSSPDDREDLCLTRDAYDGRLPDGVTAVALAAGGNLICLDMKRGGVHFWDHETEGRGPSPSFESLIRLADSFSQFLERLRPFDPKSVKLDPGQIVSMRIRSGFFKKRFKT